MVPRQGDEEGLAMYRIREVDGGEEADELAALHQLSFLDDTKAPDFDDGYWWVAYNGNLAVAFAGVMQSFLGNDIGYFNRVGVLPNHRGHGLQRRLMKAFEAKSKRVGWSTIVTDTTDNNTSANNIITCGYKLFTPSVPWAFHNSLYWYKRL